MNQSVRKLCFLGAVVFCLFYGLRQWTHYTTGITDRVIAWFAYPITTSTNFVGSKIKNYFKKKKDYNQLAEAYDALQQRYLELLDSTIQLTATKQFSASLEEVTQFQDRYKTTKRMLGKVVSKHIDSTQHYFLINKGARDGVEKDMIALFQNHLVGHVSQVHDWFSKITLITDEKSKVAAYASKTHASGIVQGFNSSNTCNFTYVSHLFKIDDNDLVISSGEGLVYPEGFCLGRITVHSLKEKELYHIIEIRPLINLSSLRWVTLIKPESLKGF